MGGEYYRDAFDTVAGVQRLLDDAKRRGAKVEIVAPTTELPSPPPGETVVHWIMLRIAVTSPPMKLAD